MTALHSPALTDFELITDRWTEAFWHGAQAHLLCVPRCLDCGRHRMPPGPFCPHCWSQRVEWYEASGDGILYSYTIVRQAARPALAYQVPYAIAVVELPDAGNVRLVTNLVETDDEQLAVGLPLEVVWWRDDASGVTVPRFRPRATE